MSQMTTGGYLTCDEFSGEEYRLPYDYPFVVRGQDKSRGMWDRPEWHTVASFKTEALAFAWLAQWKEEYLKGPNGFARMRIENWNK